MDAIHDKFSRHYNTLAMDKQLAREKSNEDYDYEEKLLRAAKFELPDHLKKFKGIYHQGEFGKQKIDNFPKEFMDVAKDLNENIMKRMEELKEIGKLIKKRAYR